MMKLLVLTALACLLLSSSVQSFQGCGKQLSETLSMVCGGEYYEPEGSKRSIQGSQRTSVGSISNWIMARQGAARLTRGVVDECCRQSCTIQTLASYCG